MLKIYSQNSNVDGYYTVATPLSDFLGGEVFFLLPESLVKAAIRPQLLASALFILLLTGLLFYVCYLVSRLLTRQYEINNLRMELELLQLRFNPHLLYNTLNALCYQIKNPSARSTIGSLCQYYRIVLNNGYLLNPHLLRSGIPPADSQHPGERHHGQLGTSHLSAEDIMTLHHWNAKNILEV